MTDHTKARNSVVFCTDTLNAIQVLIEGTDGVYDARLYRADGFKPKGHRQDCDLGVVPHEWVDQTENGGFTGDSFSGTIAWDLGSHFLVAQYSF